MPKTKAPPAEIEAKGEEQEQVTPETEETASPPEAETQEQRGEETPDPLAGATFQQLQEHPHFKEDWESLTAAQKEAQEKAYRDGQSAGAKQADEKTREFAAAQQAIKTFDDLEGKRRAGEAGDPDAGAEYAQAMGDSRKREAYERGREAKQGPGAQEVANYFLTQLDTHLNDRKELQGLSDEEKAGLAKENHPTLSALVDAKVNLAIQRGTAAGRKDEDAKQLKDSYDQGHRDAYDEMGLKYPAEEIEGGAPPDRLPTKGELGKKSVEELVELEKKGKLDKILSGRK